MNDPIKTHLDCPDCGHSECLSEWADGGTYCHSCHSKKGSSTYMTSTKEYTEVYKSYRGISKEAVDKYKVSTSMLGTSDVRRVYPYPHANKYRHLPKNFNNSDNKGFTGTRLFGSDKFPSGVSKAIVITEGEDDALSAWDMLGRTIPCVSLPSSSFKDSLLKNEYKYLDGFKEIILAIEDDTAGNNAANRIAQAFPNRVYRMHLTKHKDANEYLENGSGPDFKYAFINKKKYVPEFDTSTPDGFLELLDKGKDSKYLPTGITEYDENHLGLFQGHFTLLSAPEGTGKTEVFHYFEYMLLKNYPDVPFAACHLEETKLRTTLSWASYELNKNVTRKDLITNESEVRDAIRRLTEHENAHLFSLGLDEDPIVILDRVKYYATVCGCKFIFIEPIQDLAQQDTSGESSERFLSKIAVGLARIASELDIGIVAIAHENDDGLISDCRKLAKQASVRLRLIRDIDSADPDIRNITTIRSTKNRPASFVGYGGQLKFDPETFKLEEYVGAVAI